MIYVITLNLTDISSYFSFLRIGLEDIFSELHPLGLASTLRILMFLLVILSLFLFCVYTHNYYSINILILC